MTPARRARLLKAGPDQALALLHFAFRAVVAGPDAALRERGLGRVHHRILFFIAREPNQRVVDLREILGVTKQALHAPLQQLVRQKLVQSRPDPNDLRERRLLLTASGKRLERGLSGHQRRLFAAAFREVGPLKARGFVAVMTELCVLPKSRRTRVSGAPASRR